MLEKLKSLRRRYLELQKDLEKEGILSDPHLYGRISKEFHQLEKLNVLSLEYENLQKQRRENQELIQKEKDPEIIALAREELNFQNQKISSLEEKIKTHLLPTDENDEKNVILEIRSGAGGDEASLFVQELFEAYCRYGDRRNWRVDIVSVSLGNLGGYKEIISSISGEKVYSFLKYESGVHRVQRVPKTESQGRLHTSTVTVVVLPEADPVELKVSPSDLRIDVCRSSGAGGQHVNTTDSAVRIVHLPTKIMVYCQQEKSQHANKEKALKILYARLKDAQEEKIKSEESEKRQKQMGTGDRSQRIRTYNFPQCRITDHRIPLTMKNLPAVLEGDFDPLFSALKSHYQNQMFQEENGDCSLERKN